MLIFFDSYNLVKMWFISRFVKYEKINIKYRFKNICNKIYLFYLKFLCEYLWVLIGL